MSKKSIKICMSILLVILLVIGIILLSNKQSDSKKFANEYKEVTENNVFVYRDLSQIIKILENGTGVVYLGFPSCKWCQAYVKYLNEAAQESGISKIYYHDIYLDRKNNTLEYQRTVDILSDYLSYDEEGNKRIYVPEVVFIKDGKIIGHDNETSMISNGEPSNYWSVENIRKLKLRLSNCLDEIKKDMCDSCN